MCELTGTWNCPHSSNSKVANRVSEADVEKSDFLREIFKGNFDIAFEIIAEAEAVGLFSGDTTTQLLNRLTEAMG